MTRWSAVAGAVVLAGLAGCSAATPPTPSPSPIPTPTLVDVAAQAADATSAFLKDNSYTVSGVAEHVVTFGEEGQTYTSTVKCEGGDRHSIGWVGVCAAPSEEAIGVVVAVSVTRGPEVTTYALDADAAAYCGDETTPKWVKAALKKATGEYCYLSAEDG